MIPRATDITVWSTSSSGRTRQSEPVTTGVPLPRGAVRHADRISLTDDHGVAVPLQAVPTEWWPDGSLRWVLLDFQVTGFFADERRYRLEVDRSAGFSLGPRIALSQTADGLVVETGAARFELRRGITFPFHAATIGGAPVIDSSSSALVVTDRGGTERPVRMTTIEAEARGPLRCSVRLEGVVGLSRRPLVQVIARFHFFAGSAAVRMSVTIRNPRRARHAGGCWELGDGGSIYLRDVSVHCAVPSPFATVECSRELEVRPESFTTPFELYQDSSGGENWRHVTHVNRDGDVPCTFRGYRVASPDRVGEGRRATPAVRAAHAAGSTAIAVEHFWQNFPKAIEADGRELVLRLWPRQFADVHELQGGEQKTHVFTLAFGGDPIARDAIHWGRTPSIALARSSWYAAAGAVPHLSPADDDYDRRYARLVQGAVDGLESFKRKREIVDEYGWRHFGDLYADHENAFSGETAPIVSHYNNQYDAIGGFATQLMRTGDVRWWRLMNELARHVADIDVYHTNRDKAAYNGGLFWHTYHYVPAGKSGHRSYPRHAKVCGGGPANEHNYTAGLRLHWLLTGDAVSREAALGLAGWVIDMDDGRTNLLRWLSRAPTGLASATQSPDFHGPGRGAGHSILALLDGHRLTGDRRFLAKAEALIRRSINPADNIAALRLLDAERRWSYTVFLQALGKYLHYKAELGELDVMYAHARESLLHYARWMADHEYPYLTRPEILEYPTETWAAQDIRKADVFSFAAQHADRSERERFIERARDFFDYSVSTLLGSETRGLTRPMVLLLSNGFMHLSTHGAVPRAVRPRCEPIQDFGAPAVFQSQKAIAKKRLTAASAVAAVAAVISALAEITAR